MNRIDITYGQLDRALRAMKLSRRLATDHPPAHVYEHKKYGVLFSLPTFPESDRVLDMHFLAVRTLLDQFGIAEPTAFDAELQKAA